MFLAHAAVITDLYVALQTRKVKGLREFDREPRLRFRDGRRERTLAPDAILVHDNQHGEPSLAFVEMDLGTMSHTRLHAKAEMYVAFAASDAWRESYEFLPALVLLTTSEPRTLRFLRDLRTVIEQRNRRHVTVRLTAAAGPVVHAPGRMLTEACLTRLDGESAVTLADVLTEARAPFDQELRAAEKQRRRQERKRAQIREDPLVVRRLLRREDTGIPAYLWLLGEAGCTAAKMAVAPQPIPDLDHAQQVLEDFTLFWQREQDPDAKRRFLSLIFQGIWLDENRVVAVQPKPSFLPFFENQRPKSAAGAGVKYGSDGGRTRVRHRIEIREQAKSRT